MSALFDSLYKTIQEACPPGLWSRGVSIARAGSVVIESEASDELVVRVVVKDRPTSPRVQLWPEEEDWFCDCGDRNDACAHAAAAVIAAKGGQVTSRDESTAKRSNAPFVGYRFKREYGALSFERVIVRGGMEEPLVGTLVSYVGGVSSGRIESLAVVVSKEDFAADGVLLKVKRGVLDRATLSGLFALLRDNPNVMLDGTPVRVSGVATKSRVRLSDDGLGFALEVVEEGDGAESFSNGAVLIGGVLRPRGELLAKPRRFSQDDLAGLATEIVPPLESAGSLEVLTKRLPRRERIEPRLILKLDELPGATLSVVARLVYGDPPVAEVCGERIDLLSRQVAPIRDRPAEQRLLRKLKTELNLAPAQLAKFSGADAVRFRSSLSGWSIEGRGVSGFSDRGLLAARFEVKDGDFSFDFSTLGGSSSAENVLRAWRAGDFYVPLLGGGFGSVPRRWLDEHGAALEAFLSARDSARDGKLPASFLPALASFCEDVGVAVPEAMMRLKRALETFSGIEPANLPADLRAELRPYQRSGVDWLCFLRSNGMGALLADDMGLGKTLQALCAIQGRTLIVAPTSVLRTWADEIARFRPKLKFGIYHGSGRTLDRDADVVVTSYSILRRESDALCAEEWDTIVLDEAQTIKNPESQIARAAHLLRGRFRLALTGTPIENRLDDLWSQFQFLNPGLLGKRESFAVGVGSADVARLKRLVKPFVLRRVKRDVARELPPRTEVDLKFELSAEEKTLYETVLASTRQDLVSHVQRGASVIQLLEALLRLRQVCCHPSLLPGQKAATSSKLELLLDRLSEITPLGHRALIFSQWTSFLDLVERRLDQALIPFCRLDGSTADRAGVVTRFQDPAGPPVMLLSLKAGGVGLTLTAADHVFLLDPWWNPAVEDQAADRAHRIGQENPVIVHRLVAAQTVEERILDLQRVKKDLARSVLEDSVGASKLTREDLLGLFDAPTKS